ncbi:hypothetical protein SASPL_141159 [Salvia splendens]|uniref:Uncharacterized protein n=1 Tax=Salvia splendens TaxID=180675 RepID=A0A8X8WT28_SALSN|nr:hypothetical protein SASPL_141159 [Salvia splendens]
MAEEKDATSVPLSQSVGEDGEGPDPEDPLAVLFFKAGIVLFPAAVTFFVTWWFVQFVDGFFSPLYEQLGIEIFDKVSLTSEMKVGLGFVTSLLFVFLVGVFVSSWLGASVIWLGEWFIKRMPFVRHIYSASKQISSAISPDQNTTAFKEVAIIRHPRVGEYAFGFITSSVVLQRDDGDEELCSVFVPTNHLYIGDIFLVSSDEIIRPNLSIREGIVLSAHAAYRISFAISNLVLNNFLVSFVTFGVKTAEIIVSGGMTMPQRIMPISSIERVARPGERILLTRLV